MLPNKPLQMTIVFQLNCFSLISRRESKMWYLRIYPEHRNELGTPMGNRLQKGVNRIIFVDGKYF